MPSVTRSPAAAANEATASPIDWLSPTNVLSSNNTYASTPLNEGTVTRRLKATGFGFSIPAGATINGVVLSVERRSNFNAVIDISGAYLVKAGTTQTGGGQAKTGTPWTTADVVENLGGAADLWGNAWTADDINHAGFGGAIIAQSSLDGAEAYVDHISITVHYTEAAPPAASAHAGAKLRALGFFGPGA